VARYRLLADHVVAGASGTYLTAGSIVSDSAGAQLPSNFIPTPYCDPLDTDAVNKFYLAGPGLPGLGLLIPRWVGVSVPPPVTRWVPNPNPTAPGNPYREYVLTGLGAGLPFAQAFGGGCPPP
jgi:hypothetical protein